MPAQLISRDDEATSSEAGSTQTLSDRIEQVIRQRTLGLVRGLRVEVFGKEVHLTGRTTTYYAKQLATHAALEACEALALTNEIEVT